MLTRVLALVGLRGAAGGYEPYSESDLNVIYNQLFCDDLELFRTANTRTVGDSWTTLFAEELDKAALERIAENESEESRIRALAFERLRSAGVKLAPKKVLGFIVEVSLENGLDVLAAYSDGRVRYLSQSGTIVIRKGDSSSVEALTRELTLLGQNVVNQIGPRSQRRLPPPSAGMVRLSFVVSDGRYFTEGLFADLERDVMTGPLLAKATELLQLAVQVGFKKLPSH